MNLMPLAIADGVVIPELEAGVERPLAVLDIDQNLVL